MSKADTRSPDPSLTGINPKGHLVTALSRGLEILRCFERPGAELTVSQIARQVGLSQPTTWRLCATLIDGGFLIRSPHGPALRIGASALTLGYAAIVGMDLPAIARPYLKQIADRTGGTLTLTLRRETEIMSVEQCNGEFVLPNQPVGWRASLSTTPSGLAVLAVLPEEDREATMKKLALRDPDGWPRRRERIDRARDAFARNGHVMLSDMMRGQYAATAVPLVAQLPGDITYWALSCGGLRAHWDDARLAEVTSNLHELKKLLQPAAALSADWPLAETSGSV